jgi:hypothetical protein
MFIFSMSSPVAGRGTVYDSTTHTTRRVRNADETEAALAALAAIEELFSLCIGETQRLIDSSKQPMPPFT